LIGLVGLMHEAWLVRPTGFLRINGWRVGKIHLKLEIIGILTYYPNSQYYLNRAK